MPVHPISGPPASPEHPVKKIRAKKRFEVESMPLEIPRSIHEAERHKHTKRGAQGMTTTYQVYFLADGRTQDREDFQADDDVAAIRIARVLYDACSDVCEAFELWQGRREIRAAQPPHYITARLADLIEAHQRVTIDREEAMSQSRGMIARSRRLIAMLDGVKAKATAAS